VATLVDTNILLRSLNPADPQYQAAIEAPAKLPAQNETLCIAPQNLVEFWAVATRPANKNGLGMTSVEAGNQITGIRQFFAYCTIRLKYWKRGKGMSFVTAFQASKRMMPTWPP
jgi:hypothetical protein